MPENPTTFRLLPSLREKLELVSQITGNSKNDIMNEALRKELDFLMADVEFRIRLKNRIEQDSKILDRLRDG